MHLFYRKSGSGAPLIILHGLYGSSDNWYSIGRELSSSYTIYLLDQRNHGNSPHDPVHNYDVLASDLFDFIRENIKEPVMIMGHSMGGKTALSFGLKHPELVGKMIVVDMSPLGYDMNDASNAGNYHMQIIRALQSLKAETLSSREEADRMLSEGVPSPVVRQFLLKNLKRTPDGKFHWAFNLQALAANMPQIFYGVIDENTTDPRSIPVFPLLFIKGERSPYIGNRDEEAIHQYFPKAEISVVPDAGHWVHAEQPKVFLETVKQFLGHKIS
jgi:pimeloyl-ACP methyl ester carboxylesterase